MAAEPAARPLILDMALCGESLRIWADREGRVHIASDGNGETEISAIQWNELVVAIRRGDWERRS
jgi:hypothetical protein